MKSLSPKAAALLQSRLVGKWVEVTEASRPLYRELVAAGLMISFHAFSSGNEGTYRLTEVPCDLRDARLTAPACPTPSS